jgi:iron complex transport system substrate-binding protein
MVAAKQTFIDSMITEAGFDNVFGKEQRYPEISLQDPRLAMADLIFLSSEPYPFKETHVATFQSKFPDKDVRIVNGEMFSWYGSRMRLAFDYFWSLKEKSV